MGAIGPIPRRSIEEFSSYMHGIEKYMFVRCIRAMDSAYMKEIRGEDKTEGLTVSKMTEAIEGKKNVSRRR